MLLWDDDCCLAKCFDPDPKCSTREYLFGKKEFVSFGFPQAGAIITYLNCDPLLADFGAENELDPLLDSAYIVVPEYCLPDFLGNNDTRTISRMLGKTPPCEYYRSRFTRDPDLDSPEWTFSKSNQRLINITKLNTCGYINIFLYWMLHKALRIVHFFRRNESPQIRSCIEGALQFISDTVRCCNTHGAAFYGIVPNRPENGVVMPTDFSQYVSFRVETSVFCDFPLNCPLCFLNTTPISVVMPSAIAEELRLEGPALFSPHGEGSTQPPTPARHSMEGSSRSQPPILSPASRRASLLSPLNQSQRPALPRGSSFHSSDSFHSCMSHLDEKGNEGIENPNINYMTSLGHLDACSLCRATIHAPDTSNFCPVCLNTFCGDCKRYFIVKDNYVFFICQTCFMSGRKDFGPWSEQRCPSRMGIKQFFTAFAGELPGSIPRHMHDPTGRVAYIWPPGHQQPFPGRSISLGYRVVQTTRHGTLVNLSRSGEIKENLANFVIVTVGIVLAFLNDQAQSSTTIQVPYLPSPEEVTADIAMSTTGLGNIVAINVPNPQYASNIEEFANKFAFHLNQAISRELFSAKQITNVPTKETLFSILIRIVNSSFNYPPALEGLGESMPEFFCEAISMIEINGRPLLDDPTVTSMLSAIEEIIQSSATSFRCPSPQPTLQQRSPAVNPWTPQPRALTTTPPPPFHLDSGAPTPPQSPGIPPDSFAEVPQQQVSSTPLPRESSGNLPPSRSPATLAIPPRSPAFCSATPQPTPLSTPNADSNYYSPIMALYHSELLKEDESTKGLGKCTAPDQILNILNANQRFIRHLAKKNWNFCPVADIIRGDANTGSFQATVRNQEGLQATLYLQWTKCRPPHPMVFEFVIIPENPF